MAKAKPVEEPGLGHNVLKASELTSFIDRIESLIEDRKGADGGDLDALGGGGGRERRVEQLIDPAGRNWTRRHRELDIFVHDRDLRLACFAARLTAELPGDDLVHL